MGVAEALILSLTYTQYRLKKPSKVKSYKKNKKQKRVNFTTLYTQGEDLTGVMNTNVKLRFYCSRKVRKRENRDMLIVSGSLRSFYH